MSEPIAVPPLDYEAIAEELARRLPEVQEELRKLEEAKKVSQATMQMVITF